MVGNMKNTIIWLFASMVSLLSACNHDDEKLLINQADYTSYADYWFDKTLLESGDTTASPDKTEFDFDVLPPNFYSSYRFKIKNTGNNPLKFLVGPMSCRCTEIKLLDREVATGETGEVEVHWKTVPLAKQFNHTATIYTNDPDRRTIRFNIKGRVGKEVAFTPGLFNFPRIQPESEQVVQEVLIFSEEWDFLDIKDITSSFGSDAELELVPMRKQQQETLKATVGKNIRLTYKPPQKSGLINGYVAFKILGPGREIDHRIEVKGKRIRRLSLEDTNNGVLTPDGVLHFGRVDSSLGRKEKFFVKVNDPDKTLNLENVECNPDYFKVDLRPLNSKVDQHGVYVMEISIPKDLPQAVYNRKGRLGKLIINFDHPRVAPFDLKIDYYIL